MIAKLVSSSNKITFRKAFSQKIEKRTSIGVVAGILGLIEWKSEEIEFFLADVETNPVQSFYSTQKVKKT